MSSPEVLDVLNELLTREQSCVALRLDEAGTFVHGLAIRQGQLLHRLAAQSREHVARVATLITSLGGTPAPRVADVRSTEMHYWGVDYAMAHLVEDQEELIDAYSAAGARVAGEPRAQRLIGEILLRHQSRLAEIKALLPPNLRAVS